MVNSLYLLTYPEAAGDDGQSFSAVHHVGLWVKRMIEGIPVTIDPLQAWLVDYWASELGISPNGLRLWVDRVGPQARSVEKSLKNGVRIAIQTESGESHLVARLSLQQDGFAFSVPYFRDKQGSVIELPIRYDKSQYTIPASEGKLYSVSDVVKLSVHRDGFVQFSKGGSKPIVSGFNKELEQAKGAGLHAPEPVSVSSGPICTVVVQGLAGFRQWKNELAEVFAPEDLWYHPEFSSADCTAYNLEVFMLSRTLANQAFAEHGKLILRHELPFDSNIRFRFAIRVVELPHQPFALGLILSRMRADRAIESGFRLGGPGCVDARTGEYKSLFACYPPHPGLAALPTESLDYQVDG
ncbi:MAG: DUF3606 domain-containing protein [Pirellulales bacterium]